jgi:hypothetical protein
VGRKGEPDKKAGSEPKDFFGQPQNERLVGRFQMFFILPPSRSVGTIGQLIGAGQVKVASEKNPTMFAPYPVKKAMSIVGEEPNPGMR